jgi:signal transduction histidine kinase
MLKRIKIRGKLLLLLTAPLLAVLVFAFSGVIDRTEIADARAENAQLASFAQANADLSVTLQIERFRTLLSNRLTLPTAEVRPDQVATDEQTIVWLTAVDRSLGSIDSAELADQIIAIRDRVTAAITDDRTERYHPVTLSTELNNLSAALQTLNSRLISEAGDLQLFSALDLSAEVGGIQESLAEIAFIGSNSISGGELTASGSSVIDSATSSIGNRIRSIRETAAPQYVAILDQLQEDGALPSYVGGAVTRSGPWVPVDALLEAIDSGAGIGAINWVSDTEERFIAVSALSEDVLTDANSEAALASKTAADEARSFLILAASVVVFALVMAFVVGRSVSRPLTQLTRSAEQLSSEELPAMVESLRTAGRSQAPTLTPIKAKGRDEIASLSRAFSEIQTVTSEVAEEQGQLLRRGISDIFVNLARRNQSLLDRQIDFIDQLESREENPDALENLFRLDHLATRMRRNAESLLVLAGAEPSRRRGRPVELSDVVRVAMGEIEDFGRIQLLSIDSATVAGSVAVDLAHLLSELMENATHFSPPDTGVEVVGQHSSDGTYQMTLSDRGIGMSAEQLLNANKTLDEPPIIGLDLSRSLGFTVVSRLAHRLGVDVRLSSAADGGVTAVVTVPAEMIGNPDEGEPPVAPAANDNPVFAPADTPPAQADFAPPAVPVFEAPAERAPGSAAAPGPLPAAPAIAPAEPAPVATGAEDLAALPMRKAQPEVTAPPSPTPLAAPEPSGDLFEVFNPATTPAAPANPDADLFAALDAPPPPLAPPATPTSGLPPLPQRGTPELPQRGTPELPQRGAPEPPAAPPTASTPFSDAPVPAVAAPLPAAPVDQRPAAEIGAIDQAVTSAGLIRRTPKQVDVPDSSKFSTGPAKAVQPSAPVNRSPEEVRQMLSRYRAGLRKGRAPEPGDANSPRRS